jgi:hypothetical protein
MNAQGGIHDVHISPPSDHPVRPTHKRSGRPARFVADVLQPCSSKPREVAALIEATGGKFTDSLDRAIERRLFDRQ